MRVCRREPTRRSDTEDQISPSGMPSRFQLGEADEGCEATERRPRQPRFL